VGGALGAVLLDQDRAGRAGQTGDDGEGKDRVPRPTKPGCGPHFPFADVRPGAVEGKEGRPALERQSRKPPPLVPPGPGWARLPAATCRTARKPPPGAPSPGSS